MSNKRKTTDYKTLTDIEHVYRRPDTYIGSDNCLPKEELIYNFELNKIVKSEIDLPEGIKRLYLEILSNAGDNCDVSRRAGLDPQKIEVYMDKNQIKIKNYGLHIPVKKICLEKTQGGSNVIDYSPEKGDDYYWLPEFIFGHFRTSNNYEKQKKNMGHVAGRNGYGAKLTNIFSEVYSVSVCDPDEGKIFKGTWKDNMFKDSDNKKPHVEVRDGKFKDGWVEISYILDFKRFKLEEYREKDIQMFAKIALDFSFTCKIKIIFNDKVLDFRNIKDYAKLYWDEEIVDSKNTLITYKWEKEADKNLVNASAKVKEKKIIDAKNPDDIPELEILVLDTPDNGKCVSYVNGLITVDGGVHVDAVQTPIFNYLIKLLSEGKKKKDKKLSISSKNIRPHLSFIVNARLADPAYNSQSKTKLTSPNISFKFKDNELKKFNDWEVINRLYAEMDAIAYKNASNSDGKKKKHIEMDKGEDAGDAGTKNSSKCTLYLVEGNSAANYPQKRICMLKGGKKFNGYMPLKGKFLNVTKASTLKYSENKVITSIKQIIGLREGLDYTLDHNVETLRYGFIILTVDADDDGMHIMAHLLNFFREKFPGLLKRNMIGYLRTPIVKVIKNNKIIHRFFNQKTFDVWSKNEKNKNGLTTRYYKGLGTSNDRDIEDDLTHAPTIICFHDEECIKNFNVAFHEDNAEQRKKWIEKWRDVSQVDDIVSVNVSDITNGKELVDAQDISQFLNRELVSYSVASLFRAIPSEYDHLKESQRKALYSALVYFNYDPKKGKSIKTGRFANKAADMSHYHHGEKSLTDTIIKMAQDFTGSNNFGYFKKDGQFGTRADGGENAADARYSETHLTWWIPFVYQKESIELVEKRKVDDEEAEPLWLPGVIPMGIVNGTNGIATAFSTSTPSHNPLDVIKWYKKRCLGEETKPIVPWFDGYEGKMEIVDRTKGEKTLITEEILPTDINTEKPLSSPTRRARDIEDDDQGVDRENLAIFKHAKDSKYTLRTYGKYEVTKFHKNDGPVITITELPIKTWIGRYRKWIESELHKKGGDRLIFDMVDNSTTEKPYFEIHWNSRVKEFNYSTLHLIRNFGISNITLIDHYGFPTKYESIEDVMEKYYVNMIKHYEYVRTRRIDCENEKVQTLSNKIKFIAAVLKKDIVLLRAKEEEIKQKMKDLKIPFDIYDKSKSRDFSQESIDKYQKMIEEAKERLSLAEKTSSQQIWLGKLEILEKEFRKRYKKKKFIKE